MTECTCLYLLYEFKFQDALFIHTLAHTPSSKAYPVSSSLLMDFSKLSSNPRTRPLIENPYLLQDMEKNQFINSKSSPFKVYNPKPQTSRPTHKKPKRGFKNFSIPFYQSSKFQVPNVLNPRPRKPYWPRVYSRKQFPNQTPRNFSKPPPPPELVNPSNSKKFLEMIKNVQPGINVQISGEVETVVRVARWEGLVSNLGKRFYTHLMGEFYCNVKVIKGLDGVLHFTTIVGRKTILVDHKTINKALHLPTKLTELPCIDFYSYFIFNKPEFQLMLSIFSNWFKV